MSVKDLFRRLRGMLGVGVTWGSLWAAIGAGIGLAVGLLSPASWDVATSILDWTMGMGLYGLVSGVGFGAVLSVTEGRRTLQELSLRRVALWGVVGSAAVPLLFGALGTFAAGTTAIDVIQAILVTATLGGIFAPAGVAAAKRAELSAGDALNALGPGGGR